MRYEFTSESGRRFAVVAHCGEGPSPSVWLEAGDKTVDPDNFGDALLRELAALATISEGRSAPAENLPVVPEGAAEAEVEVNIEGRGLRRFKIKVGKGGECSAEVADPTAGERLGYISAGRLIGEASRALLPHFVALSRGLGRAEGSAEAEPILRQARDEAAQHANESARLLARASAAEHERDVARERIAELETQIAASAAANSRKVDLAGMELRLELVGLTPLAFDDRWSPPIEVSKNFTADSWRDLLPRYIEMAKAQAVDLLRGAQERIAALEQTEFDSRAEVADLLVRLEEQKARAEEAERKEGVAKFRGLELAAESIPRQNEARRNKTRADSAESERDKWREIATSNAESWHLARADAVAAERRVAELERVEADLSGARERASLAEKALAELEADFSTRLAERMEGYAQGCVAASKARAEGDLRRVVSLQSDESGLYLLLADGSAWYGKHWPPEWQRVPLPPVVTEEQAQDVANCPEPRSFAADVPASILPNDLAEALRQTVSDYGVRVPARGEPACSRCGFWAATAGLPEMPVCAKCHYEIAEIAKECGE